MKFDSELFDLDFLVYSSHKTTTQTLVASLRAAGFCARHCHLLKHVELPQAEFLPYLQRYSSINKKKLRLVSVFRDPIDRLISSFFQWHGTRPIRDGEVASGAETLIGRKSIPELQTIFLEDYCEVVNDATAESLDEFCERLSIDVKDLTFSESQSVGVNELALCTLYLFRFDSLVENFSALLANVAGKNIDLTSRNTSDSKFYSETYREFKFSLKIPQNTVERIYSSRRALIEVFYGGRYQERLDRALLCFST